MKSSVNFMGSPLLSPAGFIKNSGQIIFLGVQKGEEAAALCFVLVQAVLLQKNGSVIAKCFQLFSSFSFTEIFKKVQSTAQSHNCIEKLSEKFLSIVLKNF